MFERFVAGMGGNRAVLALSLARMVDALGNSMVIIVIPLYVADMPSHWLPFPTPVLVGLLISIYGVVTTLFQPVMGALSDWVGRRKPFIQAGLLLMALGTFAFILARRYTDLLVIRSLQGIGVALTVSASVSLMAAITRKETRGGSMGIFSTLRMAGFALGPLIAGFLHVHFGFHAVFYTGSGLILLSFLCVQVWVRDAPVEREATGRPAFQIVDWELWTPGLLALGFATFVMASGFSMMTTLENEFNARLNQTALGFSIAFSALVASRLLFQMPLGRLSDHVGRKPIILAGLALMAPATALLGEAASTLQLTGLRLLQGLASAGIAAPAFALAADLSRVGGEGRQMSVITMGFGSGLALGPFIAGVLAVVLFELPFLVGGLLALVGLWVVHRYVPETVRHDRAQGPSSETPAHTPDAPCDTAR